MYAIHTHTSHYLHSQGKNHYIVSIENSTCNLIKELSIKRIYRGKRGGKYILCSWDQNGAVLSQLLKPLLNITYQKRKNKTFLLINIQSVIN